MQNLYDFHSHYFESHSVECASRKESDTQQKMQETLALLDKLQGGTYLALVPGSHPAFRHLQYESDEKLDESLGPTYLQPANFTRP